MAQVVPKLGTDGWDVLEVNLARLVSVQCTLVPRRSTPNVVEGLVKLRQVDIWRRGLLHRACITLQFTGSATPPDIHLTSFYVGVLPGLPPH